MDLKSLGYTETLEKYRKDNHLTTFETGRVAVEHKERYIVKTATQEIDAEITGNLRFSAQERADFPAVGDWVAIAVYDDLALIHHIFPRKSILQRQAVGKFGEKQIIATNIDFALIIQGVDQDFNINRLERYLAVCKSGNVEPIVLLSKTDLIGPSELQAKMDIIKSRHPDISIIPFSNLSKSGYEQIKEQLQPTMTYCVIGSSGVGKSTLINHLSETELMKTNSISSSTKKGKHTTSHRELFLLDNGAILIDTPGMREIGITENVEETFDEINELSKNCKFNNCSHIHEEGCAILEALENGELDQGIYENFLKMQREAERFQSTVADKRRKDKAFGKMSKQVVKLRRKNKY